MRFSLTRLAVAMIVICTAFDAEAQSCSDLYRAVSANDPTCVKAVLDTKVNPDDPDESGRTPLLLSLRQGDRALEVVNLLLAAGANPNGEFPDGRSPLHAVSFRAEHSLQLVRTLLAAGADPNRRNEDDSTPLHIAADGDDRALYVANALLAAGADPNRKNRWDRTPLHLAAALADRALGVVEALLAAGADSNLSDEERWTPLHEAAHRGDRALEVAKALLASGADPNLKDDDDRTPLHRAVPNYRSSRENLKIIELLLHAGASAAAQDERGRTPLHLAVRNGKKNLVALLTVSVLEGGNSGWALGVLDGEGESATALARRYAGLPPKIDPLAKIPSYRKRKVDCTEEEKRKREAEARTPRGKWWRERGFDLVPTIGPCTETQYINERGDILPREDITSVIRGVDRIFVSAKELADASQQEIEHPTSPEIHRILVSAGGEDWTEAYLVEVYRFHHARKIEQFQLAKLRLSLQQQKFDFQESKRQARLQARMNEITLKQEEVRLKSMEAERVRSSEREKREAGKAKIELQRMKVRLRQEVNQVNRSYQAHVTEMRRRQAEVSRAERALMETGTEEDVKPTAVTQQENGESSQVKGGAASEMTEPAEEPAVEQR